MPRSRANHAAALSMKSDRPWCACNAVHDCVNNQGGLPDQFSKGPRAAAIYPAHASNQSHLNACAGIAQCAHMRGSDPCQASIDKEAYLNEQPGLRWSQRLAPKFLCVMCFLSDVSKLKQRSATRVFDTRACQDMYTCGKNLFSPAGPHPSSWSA